MPKIDAATVAEHHAMRRAAVVAAAQDLFRNAGVSAVTPAAVANRSGLARTSVYQYYPSTGALVAAAVEAMFADANDRISAALRPKDPPMVRVCEYVTAALSMAYDEYGPFHQMAQLDLPEPCRERVYELHEELTAPLRTALTELGVTEPGIVGGLILGTVSAAARSVNHGRAADVVLTEALRFVTAGVRAGSRGSTT